MSEPVATTQPSPSPRRWRVPLLILAVGAALVAACLPLDPHIHAALDRLDLPGDVRREWTALQQFGQGTCIALIVLIVYVQAADLPLPARAERRRSLLRFGVALLLVGAVTFAAKLLIGRPRPRYNDPTTFLFPWRTYPIEAADGSGLTIDAHAWEVSGRASAQLWSMPSSHTAFAVVTAVYLAVLYPRLRWLFAALAVVVGAGRLVFDAHWPTDVIAGAAIALALAWPVLTPLRTLRP